ncbi:MAG: LD-carboxypeptidase [bacterium]
MGPQGELRRAPALRPGDWVGLAAPSSPFSTQALQEGIAFLMSLGLRVRCLPELSKRRKGFLAGTDAERAAELHAHFEDPEVRAIFAVRGGYGAQRILDKLDPLVIRRNPKIFVGYSDLTCLLSFLLDRCHMVCIHGPMVVEAGALTGRTKRWLWRCLSCPEALGRVPLPRARWVRADRARVRAPLVGGNLSIICSTIGTPWEIGTEGRILFLEDWGEKPYKIDRMLVQLRQAGKLSSLAGLLFGDVLTGKGSDRAARDRKIVEEVVRENTLDLGVPVVIGLPVGHGKENLPLPVGPMAELDGSRRTFSILEPAVAERS